MSRFCLTIAYDGRPYSGWQSQPTGNTVQDIIEATITRILPEHIIRLHGSGRTDAGVHALAQMAHFDAPDETRLSEEGWRRALNAHLPPTIRVMKCTVVEPVFHARFDATGKRYDYRICTGEVLPPLEAGLSHHVPKPLDPNLLNEGCRVLEGAHNFAGFAAFRGHENGTEDTFRTLWSVRANYCGDFITITFHGSGFLYKMVRLLTGGILRVAGGRKPISWLEDLLHRRVPGKCQHVAPADGLYLISVDYSQQLL